MLRASSGSAMADNRRGTPWRKGRRWPDQSRHNGRCRGRAGGAGPAMVSRAPLTVWRKVRRTAGRPVRHQAGTAPVGQYRPWGRAVWRRGARGWSARAVSGQGRWAGPAPFRPAVSAVWVPRRRWGCGRGPDLAGLSRDTAGQSLGQQPAVGCGQGPATLGQIASDPAKMLQVVMIKCRAAQVTQRFLGVLKPAGTGQSVGFVDKVNPAHGDSGRRPVNLKKMRRHTKRRSPPGIRKFCSAVARRPGTGHSGSAAAPCPTCEFGTAFARRKGP